MYENIFSLFADDTFLVELKIGRAMRVVLVIFELMFGLKVNFNKSILVGVNVNLQLLII
jgi:hypothetical protein